MVHHGVKAVRETSATCRLCRFFLELQGNHKSTGKESQGSYNLFTQIIFTLNNLKILRKFTVSIYVYIDLDSEKERENVQQF